MHDEHSPRRLRQGNDTPEPLLRAIDALRKGVDDSARLARVGQKLESVLNAPPTAATSAAQRGFFGLSSVKLVLGGLALLAALSPLLFRQHSDDGAVPGADRDGSPAATTSAAPVAPAAQPEADAVAPQAVEQTAIAPTGNASAESQPSAVPATTHSRGSKHAARSRDRGNAREAAAEQASSDEQAQAQAETPEPAPTKAVLPNPPEQPAEPAKNAQRSAAKAEQAEDATPVPAEADLLLKARKALKQDPSLALRLASEHQSYYPKGRLAPEREVLAIEALRNLGRKQEADERLQKFEARYPKSIHLQRLHEAK